jgi:REP element-mobilizing transposase RayT
MNIPPKNSLSLIVRSFKSAVSKHIHEIGFTDFSWQPRFYDRIIRDENELYNIRHYIDRNPIERDIEKDIPEDIFEM